MDFAQYALTGKIPVTLLESMLANTFTPSEVRHLCKTYRPLESRDKQTIEEIFDSIQEGDDFIDQFESDLDSRAHCYQEPIHMSSSSVHPVSRESIKPQKMDQQPSSPFSTANSCSTSMMVDSSMTAVNNDSDIMPEGITLKDIETFLEDSAYEGSTLPIDEESSPADFPIDAITSSSEQG